MAIHRPLLVLLGLMPLICLPVLAVPVQAQEHRLFAVANTADSTGQWRTQLLEARVVEGRVVSASVRAEVPGVSGNGIVVAAGGRFVLWQHQPNSSIGLAYAAAFDRSSGHTILVPAAGFISPVADPVNPRVFFSSGTATPFLATLSVNGIAALPGTEWLEPSTVSRDGQRLYAIRHAMWSRTAEAIAVVDTNTGQILRSVSFSEPYDAVSRVAVNDDESAMWVYTRTITPASGGTPPLPPWIPAMETWTLRRFDLATGAETLTVPGETYPTYQQTVGFNGPFFDGTTQQLVVARNARENNTWHSSIGSSVRVLDPASGAVVAETAADGLSTLYLDRATQAWLNVDQKIIAGPLTQTECPQLGFRAGTLAVPGAPVASVFGGLPCLTVAFASTPAAPQVDPPVIAPDGTVSLSWSGPDEPTTGYVVEAGGGPGLADIASFAAPGTPLVVPHVPPGHYYVRVRAVNHIGPGVASSEILIQVP